jgi:hypothetical protein
MVKEKYLGNHNTCSERKRPTDRREESQKTESNKRIGVRMERVRVERSDNDDGLQVSTEGAACTKAVATVQKSG